MPRQIRDDLSDRLIHLTKGTPSEAIGNLISMLNERALNGGTGEIRAGCKCVCFSEAPIAKLGLIVASDHSSFRYKPYGLMFRKRWVYLKGGLPVIYQPEKHYAHLPPEKAHLHVRFELDDADDLRQIDFTWEREWRVRADRLEFTPDDVTIVVPNRDVVDWMRKTYRASAEKHIAKGESVSEDPWHYITLDDLGVRVGHGQF